MQTQPDTPRNTVIWWVPTMSDEHDVEAIRRLISVENDPESATVAEISAFLTTAGYLIEKPS